MIPEKPFSGGVPPELTHRVVAVPAFNMIEYYPNEELFQGEYPLNEPLRGVVAVTSSQYDKISCPIEKLCKKFEVYLKNHGRDSRNTFFRGSTP